MKNPKNDRLEEVEISVVDKIEVILMGISASIPGVASLSAGWSEWKNAKQTQYLNDLLVQYFEKMKELENRLDNDYIKTDEAKSILERTANKAKDETRTEKRALLAQFLATSSTKELSGDKEKEMVLETIDKLSPLQTEFLHLITALLVTGSGKSNVLIGSEYDPKDKNKVEIKYTFDKTIVQLCSHLTDKDSIESALDYMISVGVIETHSARGFSTLGGQTGIKGYRPTKLGLKTLKYLDIDIDNIKVTVPNNVYN